MKTADAAKRELLRILQHNTNDYWRFEREFVDAIDDLVKARLREAKK